MKKVMAMLVAAGIAGVASADIAVSLQNGGGVFTTGGGAAGADVLVQLVWNDGSAVDTGTGLQVDAGLTAAGDAILSQFTTTPGFWGTWSDQGDMGGQYAQSTAGYLTVRVFNAADYGVGALGFEFDLDVDGTLTAFDALVPSSTYTTDGTLGGDFDSLVAGNGNVVEVVPEPATIGLMGVAGLGLFLARRKARR